MFFVNNAYRGADNYIHDMEGSGLALMESFDAEVYNNIIINSTTGIRFSLGSSNNYVHHNVFDTCSEREMNLTMETHDMQS